MEVDFGRWLEQQRTDSGINMRELARLSGVDQATISRIEAGKSSPTLASAIRLAQGLGINREEFLKVLQKDGTVHGLSTQELKPTIDVVTIEDIQNFINTCYIDDRLGAQILIDMLDMIYRAYQTKIRSSELGRGPFSNQFAENSPIFERHDLTKLLFAHPVLDYAINYPLDLSSENIRNIYSHCGALTYEDIGAYIRRLRQEKNLTFRSLGLSETISASDLSRFETGSVSKIKLNDVFGLDRALGEDGILFSMYWQADKLYSIKFQRNQITLMAVKSQEWTKQEAVLVSEFIKLARWSSYLFTTFDWLSDLRSKFLIL